MLKRLGSLVRALRFRGKFEDDMTEELAFHIEQYTDDLVRSGVSREEAARRARIEFGGLNSVKGECREARRLHLLDGLMRELRYAARSLRKSPGFTATAVATLAICLGANLTIFAVMDSALLRPLPFPDAGRLVTVFNTYPKAGVPRDGASLTNYYERRGRIPALAEIALYRYGTAILGEPGSTEHVDVSRVSPEFLSTLGVNVSRGRVFREEEMVSQADHVAILTDAYWRERFASDAHVIGKQIRVDGSSRIVVGVLPPGFQFLSSHARVYFPLSSRPRDRAPSQRHSGGNATQMIARLAPGADLMQAQAQIDAQNHNLEADSPQARMMAEAGFRSLVVPLQADHVAEIRPMVLLMQAGAMALMVIGTVNLLNLLLVRANGRVKELAVRQALGASRRHVVSEVAVETALLALAGGLAGLGVGAGGIRILAALGADQLPLVSHIALDARVGLAGLLGTISIGIVLAVPIAWFHLKGHVAMALQSESRGGTASRGAQRLRHGFIVAQIALALVLLVEAGLLGRSLERVMAVSPGFRADHVLSGKISLPWKSYATLPARLTFNERLIREMERQPGVAAAGVVSNVPFSGHSGKSAATVKGRIARPGESPRGNYSYGVDGDYFATMGIPLREGRFLTGDDSRRAERACVVDEDFARYYWPHSSALGQQLFKGGEALNDAEAFTVVGVVGVAKQAGLTEDEAQGAVYYPYAEGMDDNLFIVLRASVPPESLGRNLQRVVRQMDPDLPVNDIRPMETRIADSLITRRSPAMLAAIFSSIAVLLTAVGTYGVLSYAVAQRRREIGVRMALGAQPGQIRGHFFLVALRLLAAGTILGVLGAWMARQAMQTVLFHIPAFDLATIAAAVGVMVVVSLVACLLPSERAARISPADALADQ